MIYVGGGIFGVSVIEKMVKIIVGFGELECYWFIMKRYFGFKSGINMINLVVIEGGRYVVFIVDECWLWIIVYFYLNEIYE